MDLSAAPLGFGMVKVFSLNFELVPSFIFAVRGPLHAEKFRSVYPFGALPPPNACDGIYRLPSRCSFTMKSIK